VRAREVLQIIRLLSLIAEISIDLRELRDRSGRKLELGGMYFVHALGLNTRKIAGDMRSCDDALPGGSAPLRTGLLLM